jgi:VCBS repeat-containing protein
VTPIEETLGILTAGVIQDTTGTGINGEVGWSYEVKHSAIDYLSTGQTLIEHFVVTVDDGNGGAASQVVSIVIEGTNDSPVIISSASSAKGYVIEAGLSITNNSDPGTSLATGILAATDVDTTNNQLRWSLLSSQDIYGTITIDPSSGEWAYTLDNSLESTQNLKAGESLTEIYTARVSDQNGAYTDQPIVITIFGSNDGPIINSGPQSASLVEDNIEIVATGQIQAVDNDIQYNSLLNYSILGGLENLEGISRVDDQYGMLTINKDSGFWTYTIDNSQESVQSLKEGETVTQNYTAPNTAK